jgi:endonuclease I
MIETTVRRPSGPPSAPSSRLLLAAVALAAALAEPATAQKITEVVFDHAGADTHEFIEIAANPASVVPPGVTDTVLVDLSSYRIVVLDGSVASGGNPGKILNAFQPGMTNASGLWSTGYLTSTLERPVFTVLLVSGFSGTPGDDLDAADDGVLDATPWSAIADGVAFSDGSAGARTYAAPVLGPGFDGVAAAPGGASRFPYYSDTDSAADWKRNDFDGDGLPGFTGTLVPGEARNTPGGVTRVALADFYSGVDASSASALRSTLHAALRTHLRFPYTASTIDTWDILEAADEDPTSSTQILDVYKNASYSKNSVAAGQYNREHSWPNSYGFNNDETASEYTDCHHLFSSDITFNSNRSNKPYGTCSAGATENATVANHGFGGGTGVYPGNSNWDNGSVYEVWNHRRGDIARAQFYMDVRYEGGVHPYTGATEKDLVLTDNAALIQTNQPYMGYLSVLLQWHLEDPVDDAERARNEVVESFQGNRNPFVDHPEWVACLFQGSCAATTTLVFSGIQSATDPSLCAATGVNLAWNAPTAWNDDCTSGCNRGFRVLRAGAAIVSGGCAGPLSAGATSCTDTAGAAGVTYAYSVEAFNHQDETSTGGASKSAADRTDDGLAPVQTAGPSASSSVSSSFTVTWTTDEPSDSRVEYGATASYGSTVSNAAFVTSHSVTVTGLSAGTPYHFRAGSVDACGNGPAWSSDGTVTTAAASTTLDVGGFQLVQANSAQTYTLPAGTTVPAGGYVVIARNGDKAAFETFWGVTLGPDVVFLNAQNSNGNIAPTINGSETYTIKNASGTVLDGPTIAMASSAGQSLRRNDPCLAAGTAASWTVGASSTATPGTGAGAGCGTGLVVNEFSDASNYVFEFVELHWDAPAAAPSVSTSAATDVTTTGATVNGTVNPNGAATTVSFEWGTTTSYGQATTGQAVGSGTAAQAVSAALTGLAPCTTYHYRATATSAGGTATGDDASFRTACTGGRFHPLTPCRVLDTRLDAPMADGVPRVVTFHGACGIPTAARALATNFTATQSTLAGWVSAYPADVASTGTIVIPFAAGKTRASNTILKLSEDGTGKARLEATVPGSGTVHVVVDVSGYFD